MLTDIDTEFKELSGPFDDGVERAFRATENYVAYGEEIERVTTVRFLTDGAVNIEQRIPAQDIYDGLTLNAAVAHKIRDDLG